MNSYKCQTFHISKNGIETIAKNMQHSICNFSKYFKSAMFNSDIVKSIAIAIPQPIEVAIFAIFTIVQGTAGPFISKNRWKPQICK